MTEHILISPLGLSPGAVSGVAFGLQRGIGDEAAFPISRVLTLGTSHPNVREAAGYLKPLFAEAGIGYEPDYIPQHELRQTDGSVGTYIARFGKLLEEAQASGAAVHVAITGGRSGMGALAAMATSLYGAAHLWHLWVPEEIELKGRIGELPQPFNMSNIYLNPPPGKYELVELPFLDMRPLHPVLWEYYQTGEWPKEGDWQPLLSAFSTNGVGLDDVFPAGATTKHKRQIDSLALTCAAGGGDERNIQKQVIDILQLAGQLDREGVNQVRKFLMLQFPPSDLLSLAERQQPTGDFWSYLRSQESRVYEIVNTSKRVITPSRLIHNLSTAFDREELRSLCRELNVFYDNLPAEGNEGKARELIAYMERRGRLPELIAHAAGKREKLTWFEEGTGEIDPQPVTETDLFLLYGLQLWLNYRRAAWDN